MATFEPVSAVSPHLESQSRERLSPPFAAGEREMLTAFLDFQRATVLTKCMGVLDADARRIVAPSARMTLAGLVSHLKWTEHYWFVRVLAGVDETAPYDGIDSDADWSPAHDVSFEQLLFEYDQQCARSSEIAAGVELGGVAKHGNRPATLRWILLHMIEETARHLGHADIVREFIDGTTGV